MIKRGILPRIRHPKWESERTGKETRWYRGWTRFDVLYECSNCPGCLQYDMIVKCLLVHVEPYVSCPISYIR